jgi:enterobactin synthetase component D
MIIPQQNDDFIVAEGFADWFNLAQPIYYCKFEQENYSDYLFDQLNIPFPDSLNNAVVKRRAEFLAGRYCAMKTMRVNGVHTNEIKIGKHRNPLWPIPLIGSISHCSGLAAAITNELPSCYGLGIDIETIVETITMKNLSKQILTHEERTFIAGQPFAHDDSDRNICLLFTLIFSVKESFFKAVYPLAEEYFDFDTVSITNINWIAGTLQLLVNKTLHQRIEKGMRVNAVFTILPDEKVTTLVIIQK